MQRREVQSTYNVPAAKKDVGIVFTVLGFKLKTLKKTNDGQDKTHMWDMCDSIISLV
jgi:hypothetical protein